MSMEAPVTGSTSATVIASTVAGDGLVANGTAVDVNPGNGIDLVADAVQVQPSEIAGLGLETDGATPPKLRTKAQFRQFRPSHQIESLGAATVRTELTCAYCPVAMTLNAIRLTSRTSVTGHDTNTFTIIIRQRDGAGGAASTVVSFQCTATPNNSLTAWVPKDLGSLSVTAFPAGSIVTIEVTKQGSGLATFHMELDLNFTVDN